ncbi:MAG TPA: glutathione S-transferase [Rhodospirillales bacterium]|nr:glutathione S-transferase [Rhodospirillales bacterium]
MKLYDCASAPSPRRVHMFLAEKGLTIPVVQVDLRAGEHLRPEFLKLNPWATVPVLELDDGTTISEASACCRYIEEVHPEPPLLGCDPKEKAVIAMWDHRCEIDGFLATAEALRNEAKAMAGRALTGPVGYAQIPALAERGRARAGRFFAVLDARLAEVPFVAGAAFSVADITAFITVEFASWLKLAPPDGAVALRRWLDGMRARPSAKA